MELAKPIAVDSSGVFQLLNDEVQYRIQNEVDLVNREMKTDRKKGIVTLTSHRLIWMDKFRANGIQWFLHQVSGIHPENGNVFTGHLKIIVSMYENGKGNSLVPSPNCYIKITFKDTGRDLFFEDFQKALSRKSWISSMNPSSGSLSASSAPNKTVNSNMSIEQITRTPGIGGIIAHRNMQAQSNLAITSQAFSDLNELAKHAKIMVNLAEQYQATLSSQGARTATPSSSSSSVNGSSQNDEMSILVNDLGMLNPITRSIAGNAYVEELSRQIASWVKPILEKSGGILSLTELYCLYNRARRTDFISPDDLLAAIYIMPSLNLRMSLRKFPSGLQVLQLDSYNENNVVKIILDLLDKKDNKNYFKSFVTSLEISNVIRTPLPLAQALLLNAENAGHLCRDDSLNGLRFYKNLF
jgi:ESCRT-II complex subunit VPS36